MKQNILYIFLFFISSQLFAQNEIIIQGKITADTDDLFGINVINMTTEIGVASNADGTFSIKVKENDTLFFSAIHIEQKKYKITTKDFETKYIEVNLKKSTEKLQEIVVVEYPNINAEDLGIIPRGQKTYTPAEKKLISAGEDFKWYSPLLIPFGGMSFEGLLNDLTGRKKALKDGVVVERKQIAQEKILEYFDKETIQKTFNIPADYVDGFLFYLVENQQVINTIGNKNKTELTFVISQVSLAYLKMIDLQIKSETEEK